MKIIILTNNNERTPKKVNKIVLGSKEVEGPLVVGINNRSVFTIDTRMSSKDQSYNGFQYKTTDFTCVESTASGDLVLGDEDGSIRTFSSEQVLKNSILNTNVKNPYTKNNFQLTGSSYSFFFTNFIIVINNIIYKRCNSRDRNYNGWRMDFGYM